MANNFSLLLLRKPTGITSFESLRPVKRHVDKKVGHAGTLDKFAEGLMIVLTGRFTKLNPLLGDLDKRYVATVRFGEETDTLDPEGKVIATAALPSEETVAEVLKRSFTGSIMQSPPQYSAIHIDGKRAYRMAREGIEVHMPSRPVTIHSIRIVGWDGSDMILDVRCSKGTYIRSLARDIARASGSRAHLVALKRTEIGPFRFEDAVDPEDTKALLAHSEGSVDRLMMLDGIGRITVDRESSLRLTYGNLPDARGIILRECGAQDTHAAIFSEEGTLLAVTAIDSTGMPVSVMALPCVRSDG